MEYKDYYKILGVDKSSSEKEIKKAYRRLARKFHPDINKNDAEAEAKFKEINEAYEVLKDKNKRQKYDEFGQYYAHAGEGQPGRGYSGFRGQPGGGAYSQINIEDLSSMFGGSQGGFSDFFTSMFGGDFSKQTGSSRRTNRRSSDPSNFGGFNFDTSGFASPRQKGADAEFNINLTLEEAAYGVEKVLEFTKESPCNICRGTGNSSGSLCQMCHGRGVIAKPRRLEVKIPSGVKDGFKIRMKGEGSAGSGGGDPGDLYLVVRIQSHPYFELKNDELYCDVPITVTEAVLGGEIKLPVLNGSLTMKIPPGTQNGKIFRLREQGFPTLKNKDKKGDLFVKVKIVIPENLSDEEMELFKKLSAYKHDNPRERIYR